MRVRIGGHIPEPYLSRLRKAESLWSTESAQNVLNDLAKHYNGDPTTIERDGYDYTFEVERDQ